jgi:hypothetical protein
MAGLEQRERRANPQPAEEEDGPKVKARQEGKKKKEATTHAEAVWLLRRGVERRPQFTSPLRRVQDWPSVERGCFFYYANQSKYLYSTIYG